MTETWLGLAAEDPFGVATLPYGVVLTGDGPQPAIRIGSFALPLRPAAQALLPEHAELFAGPNLDAFLAAGPERWAQVRSAVTGWLTETRHRDQVKPLLRPLSGLRTALPFTVADYVDFYASENHARNAGRIFRPDSDSLLPNWKHLPVGYHGRAGTVVVSGTEVRRPQGQRKGVDGPEFGPSQRLDIEAEVGFVVGAGSARGRPVPLSDFARRIPARSAGADRGLRPARVRRGAAQRLVRPRHPGLGVRAARALSGQVLRDLHLGLDHAVGGPGGGPDTGRAERSGAAALPR
jgi:fumarylacetoacetase